jgi:hypothetical protein
MAIGRTYEQMVYRPRYIMGLVDGLAQRLKIDTNPVPIGEVTITLRRRTQPLPARDFDPPLQLAHYKNPSGFFLLTGDIVPAGMDDRDRVRPIQTGSYVAIIESEYYREDVINPFNWDPLVTRLPDRTLYPSPAYPFPDLSSNKNGNGLTLLRGTLRTSNGSPVVGAKVSIVGNFQIVDPSPPPTPTVPVWPFAEAVTTKDGDWALLLPDQSWMAAPPVSPVTIQIVIGNNPAQFVPGVTLDLGKENFLKNTVLRGRVVDSSRRPIAGASVQTSLEPGQTTTDRDGQWSYYFDLVQANALASITVTTPAGTSQTFPNINVEKGKTMVGLQFTIL